VNVSIDGRWEDFMRATFEASIAAGGSIDDDRLDAALDMTPRAWKRRSLRI